MSAVGLGMDALLGLLLLAALGVGLRLNGRLRALREGQGGFVKAVGELDAAAMRAEAGLSALRAATLEAHDHLLDRIDTARALVIRLDDAVETAQSTCVRIERGLADAPTKSVAPVLQAAPASFTSPPHIAIRPEAFPPRFADDRAVSPPMGIAEDAAAAAGALARFVARRGGRTRAAR